MSDSDWVNIITAAQMIGCEPATVDALIRMGELHCRDGHTSDPKISVQSIGGYKTRLRKENRRRALRGHPFPD